MKNYYKILEIDKSASQEVIEKVYKLLVKTYHPDLQTDPTKKAECEIKIKEINEAYETLSNAEKREQYDAELKKFEEQQRISTINKQSVQNTQANVHNNDESKITNVNKPNPSNQSNRESSSSYDLQREKQMQKDYQNAINKAYHDAYIQDLKNRGYKIKYKKTWHDRLRALIAILITIGILFVIFQLPPVKNYFHTIYNENPVIHKIVDTFKGS